MPNWPEVQQEAERRFLGRDQVVGIAVAQQRMPQLVFFLADSSPGTEADIARWATDNGVAFDLKVLGAFRLLKNRP